MVVPMPEVQARNLATPDPPADAPAALEVKGLGFSHGPARILADLALTVAPGECVSVFGPTGAGKTSFLRLLAGLLVPSAGEIRIGGRLVSSPDSHEAPHRRGIAMVFQGPALWPHMTAFEHGYEVARGAGLADEDARSAAREALAATGLEAFADRRPGALSGGEQQRLALARALAARPRLLLLDEPFSAIDRPGRDLLLRVLERFRTAGAVVFVTHDIRDALEASGRVAVLREGRFEQVATPARLHASPRSRFTAACVGFATFLPATRRGVDACETRWGTHPLEGGAEEPGEGHLALRLEGVALHASGPVHGVVTACSFRDGAHVVRADCAGNEVSFRSVEPLAVGSEVRLAFHGPGVFVRDGEAARA